MLRKFKKKLISFKYLLKFSKKIKVIFEKTLCKFRESSRFLKNSRYTKHKIAKILYINYQNFELNFQKIKKN